MAQATVKNPISDLMYDWVTVLKSKAEGLHAYEQYIKDAENEHAPECVQMFRRLQEQDAQMVQEIRNHLADMMAEQGKSRKVPAGAGR
jgi:hypothetical protein